MGLLVGPGRSSGEGFLSDLLSVLELSFWVLVLPYWMVLLSFATTHSPLPVRSLLGGFLQEGVCLESLRVLGFPSMLQVFGRFGGGGGGLVKGVLLVGVSKGSDLLRKPLVQLSTEFVRRPIPDTGGHDSLGVESPGPGRMVSRRVHGVSSPGSRLDREGIG